MGFFSSLVSSDDENEVKLLTAFYRLLFSCAIAKEYDEEKAGTSKGDVNNVLANLRKAVNDSGLFKNVKADTDLKIANEVCQDFNKNGTDVNADVEKYAPLIKAAGKNTVIQLGTIIVNNFGDFGKDGKHPMLTRSSLAILEGLGLTDD